MRDAAIGNMGYVLGMFDAHLLQSDDAMVVQSCPWTAESDASQAALTEALAPTSFFESLIGALNPSA